MLGCFFFISGASGPALYFASAAGCVKIEAPIPATLKLKDSHLLPPPCHTSDDNCANASKQFLGSCWNFILARPAETVLADNFKRLYHKAEGIP